LTAIPLADDDEEQKLADVYMMKPFTPEQLNQMVSRLLPLEQLTPAPTNEPKIEADKVTTESEIIAETTPPPDSPSTTSIASDSLETKTQPIDVPKMDILIIDIHQAISKLMTLALQSSGFKHIHIIHDEVEAKEWLANNSPELIILDMHRPSPLRIKIVRAIRAKPVDSQPHIIFLTLSTRKLEKDVEALADNIFSQPLDLGGILQAIRQLLPPAQIEANVHK
jgi:DNA-binding response OmpR family regulator